MTRTMMDKTIKEIKEFKDKGFAKSSRLLMRYLRHGENGQKSENIIFKIFKTGTSSQLGRQGSTKYTSTDIFGDRDVYYYDIKKEKDFVDFLVNKFLTKNPDPDESLRKVFSRLLHSNGLHWYGCVCNKRKTYPRKRIMM